MNKQEFIERIVLRHSGNLTEVQITALQEDYTTILEDNIDFDALFSSYLQEYNYNVAPKPAWFSQRAKKKIIQRSDNYEIRDLIVELPDGNKYQFAYEHPYETERQAVEAIREKFKNKQYKLFRILKIDEGEKKGIRKEKQEIF